MTHISLRPFFVVALIFALISSAAIGQSSSDPRAINYDAWESLAERAETAITNSLASNEAFEELRSEIVDWREVFLVGQQANAERIKTLRAQIEALGPLPAEGETEPQEIATRRSELNEQLATARAPGTTAVEAFSRADGLAGEIDSIIRDRQATKLLEFGSSPLNPKHWPAAMRTLTGMLRSIQAEIADTTQIDSRRDALADVYPALIAMIGIAFVLIFFGERAMLHVTKRAVAWSGPRAKDLTAFFVSMGQFVVPVFGVSLLIFALSTAEIAGVRGELVLDATFSMAVFFFVGRWLSRQLFPVDVETHAPINASPQQARTIRWSVSTLAIFMGLVLIITDLTKYEESSQATRAVLQFPFVIIAAWSLAQIGRVLAKLKEPFTGYDGIAKNSRSLSIIGRTVTLLSIASVVAAAIGYLNAAFFVLMPTAFSLLVLGVLLLLREPVRDIYAIATGATPDEAREALAPTLVNFSLVFFSLPVFALIWGARTADLTEIWALFRQGFQVGETRISPTNFMVFVLVFIGLYMATRMVQGALRNNVLPKTKIDPGAQNAIVSGVGYVGVFLAALTAIGAAGINLSSLAIVAGALSVGIGFGLQNIVQNFVSGIILLIERPVAEGDWIEVGGHMGIVKKISVRSTLVETFDRTDVIVPNGDFISSAVTNWTRTDLIGRIKVPVGVAYGNDTRKVVEILTEIAHEHPLVTVNPPPGVDFLGFGADSLDFQIRAVLRDVNFSVSVRTEMNHRITERFTEEGIEIPFTQRDVWLRNPEMLTAPKTVETSDDAEVSPKKLPPVQPHREIDEALGSADISGDSGKDGGETQ